MPGLELGLFRIGRVAYLLTVRFLGDFFTTGFLTTRLVSVANFRGAGVTITAVTPALSTDGTVVVVVGASVVTGSLSTTGSLTVTGSLSVTASAVVVVVIATVVVVIGASLTASLQPTEQSPLVTTGLLLAPTN